MKSLMVILMVIGLTSCASNEWRKNSAVAITSVAAPVIVTTFDCANYSAVQEDVLLKFEEWYKVQKEEKSLIGIVCQTAVMAVLPQLVTAGNGELPVKWGCTSSNLNDRIVELAKTACSLL